MFNFPWGKEKKRAGATAEVPYRPVIIEETENFVLISAPGGVCSGHEVLAFMQTVYNQGYMPLFESTTQLLCKKRKEAGVTVNVINNTPGAKATTKESTDCNGNRVVDVFIERIKA